MTGNLPLVVLDVGHSELEKGAVSPFHPFTSEWDYNRAVAPVVSEQVYQGETVVVFRDPVKNGYQLLPEKINALSPKLILSLHCNAASPAAFGTEMIHYPGSVLGHFFACLLQSHVSQVFGWSEGQPGFRGVKTPIMQRGSSLLNRTVAPCVIAEPFFLTNEEDHSRGIAYRDQLASAYALAINEFIDAKL